MTSRAIAMNSPEVLDNRQADAMRDTVKYGGMSGGKVRVLVTGVGGNVAQGILKALASSGLASWVVGVDANPLSVGLFWTDMGYVVPRADHPDFIESLTDILNRERIDLVLVGADAETLHVARARSVLEKRSNALVLTSSPEVVATCQDKWETAQWFKRKSLPHPETFLGETGNEAAVLRIGFPLIAKPRKGYGSKGIVRIQNLAELHYLLPKVGTEYIFQPIVGTEEQEYTAATFSPVPGKVSSCLIMHRVLMHGTSCYIEPVASPEIEEEVSRWACELGGLGPLNFQFRMTATGPVCIEVNPRFSGTVGVRHFFGYNDVEFAVRSFLLKEKIVQPSIRQGTVLRYWQEEYIPGVNFQDLQVMQKAVRGKLAKP